MLLSRVGRLIQDGRYRTQLASTSSSRFEEETGVRDLVFTLVTIGFFLLALGYLRVCERLK